MDPSLRKCLGRRREKATEVSAGSGWQGKVQVRDSFQVGIDIRRRHISVELGYQVARHQATYLLRRPGLLNSIPRKTSHDDAMPRYPWDVLPCNGCLASPEIRGTGHVRQQQQFLGSASGPKVRDSTEP
ncbi:hypothetical protein G7046_g7719 [Stylonectria norvegica]|nr:hypothetical protein G7046_g7719 [Stylonectria norvegica]